MKKLIPALLLLAAFTGLRAQGVSYTASEFGVAGDSLYYSHVTDSIPFLNYAQAGAGVSWNFATLTPTTQSNEDFLNPLTSGYYRPFLTECVASGRGFVACEGIFNNLTNVAFRQLGAFQVSTISFGNAVEMQNISVPDNSLTTNIIGLTSQIGGVPVSFATVYNQPDRVISFPITYGNADSSKSSYDIDLAPYGINFVYHAHADRVNHVDAWGSLTTPYATYASTVREYAVVVHTDTAVYNNMRIPIPVSVTFEYAWYNPSFVGPVFTASGNIYGNQKVFTNISYLAAPVCLAPRAIERHNPYNPVIQVPNSVTVNFTNFSIDANAYLWNFGDPTSGSANTSTSTNATHTYSDTGIFNLTLVACNTICIPEVCDTLPFTVVIRDSGQVRAYFFAEPTLVCAGQTVHFLNLSAHATSYLWDFGDLTTSTATNPTHIYTTPGTYTALLIAYGASGTDTDRVAITVEEFPAPVIHVSGTTTFCNGDSVTLYASGGTVYHWSSGQLASQIVVKRSGTYTVTATNNCGSQASVPVTVTVNIPVDTLVATGDTVFCEGDSVILQANTGTDLLYRWRRNGQIIIGANEDYYEAKVSGYYTVNVTEDNCIGISNTIGILVNPIPVASISTQGSTVLCTGGSLVLAASQGAGYTYQWQLNGQDIDGATGASYTAFAGGTYTAIVTHNRCPATSNSIIVTTSVTPTPAITYQGNPAVCNGDSLLLNATTGNGYTYQWLVNSEPINNAISDYYYASSAASYSVIATADGCSGTSSAVSLTVNANPVANAGSNQSLPACSDATVTLGGSGNNPTAGGGTSPYSISWTPSSGLNDASATNPVVSQLGATTTYQVLVTDANGCSATSSATVTVTGSTLSVSISSVGSSTWCEGSNGSITLTATPNIGGQFTYSWSPSTGLSDTTTAVTIASPTVPGTYNYTVLVANTGGCQAGSNITVQVLALPVAVITPLDTLAPCQGDSVELAANPGAGYTYQWLNNAEPIDGSTDINYTTVSAGAYSVSVTSGTCSAVSNVETVTVRPNPTSTISPMGNASTCVGSSVSLQASTGDGYTYQWYENDFGIAGATSSAYEAGDSASYCYIVGLNGCYEQSDSVFVTVNPYPSDDTVAINGPLQFCTGGVTTLSAAAGDGYAYQWQNNGQAIPNAQSSSYNADSTGIYTVVITALGCTDTSTGVDLTVYPYPVASIQGESSTNFCAGDSVTLAATSGPGYNYQWYVDGDTINGALDTTFVANDTGSYYVVVTQNGCLTTSNSLYVNVLPLPFALATVANNGFLCKGDSTVIYASTGSGYTYQWQVYPNSNLIGDNADSLVVSAPDIYNVIITAAGCITPSNGVTIAYDTLPAITQSGDTLYASGGYMYQWYQDSTTIIPGATLQFYVPTANGSYNVLVTDSISCTQESLAFMYPTVINPVSEIAHISMYPNPAHDEVNVVLNSKEAGNVVLRIYDLLGNAVKDVYEGNTVPGNNFYTVPLTLLPQGIYMLSIYDGQSIITEKLVKE